MSSPSFQQIAALTCASLKLPVRRTSRGFRPRRARVWITTRVPSRPDDFRSCLWRPRGRARGVRSPSEFAGLFEILLTFSSAIRSTSSRSHLPLESNLAPGSTLSIVHYQRSPILYVYDIDVHPSTMCLRSVNSSAFISRAAQLWFSTGAPTRLPHSSPSRHSSSRCRNRRYSARTTNGSTSRQSGNTHDGLVTLTRRRHTTLDPAGLLTCRRRLQVSPKAFSGGRK